jgi:hypothetical protein
MSKKSRRKKKRQPRQTPWLWLALGGALVLIVGAFLALRLQPGSEDEAPGAPQAGGAPRLVVDQTTIDEGYIKYDVPIRTTFRLSNVGDQPLEIQGTPQVSLVQGC